MGNLEDSLVQVLFRAEKNNTEGGYHLWDKERDWQQLLEKTPFHTTWNCSGLRSVRSEHELFLPTLAQIDNSSEINPGPIFEPPYLIGGEQKHTSPLRDEIRSCHLHALLASDAHLEAGLAFENEIWIEMAQKFA